MNDRRLGTKAETLELLYGQLKNARVLEQFSFTVGDWNGNRDAVVRQYRALPWRDCVIVRSSSLNEDTAEFSLAGKYESILDVCGELQFCQAVDKVIASYDDTEDDMREVNQILVQPMLKKGG